MKKLIMALAAVAAASLTQAATVNWNSGDLSEYVTDDIASITGYYYVLGGNTAVELSNYVNDDGSLKNTNYDGKSDPVDATTEIVNVNMTQANAESPTYVALVYVAKSVYGGSYAIATKGVYEVDPDTGWETDNNTTSGAIIDAIESAGSVKNAWTAVPEPTTVALLALGLAAVGLKRKVA